MAEKTRQGTLFDNERVRFFLRRLTERALTDFRKMLNMTVQQYGENWQGMWQQTLPRIKSWPPAAIASIAREFERDVGGDAAALLTELTFIRYVCLGYGKDAYGNKNKLEVDPVPFSVLYRAFLIRLARTPEMIRGSWFNKSEEMDRTCANALSDALHDVCENRVRVLGPASVLKETRPQQVATKTKEVDDEEEEDARTHFTPKPRKHHHQRMSTVSRQAFSTVTPNDSASQMNSLGVRHQRFQRSTMLTATAEEPLSRLGKAASVLSKHSRQPEAEPEDEPEAEPEEPEREPEPEPEPELEPEPEPEPEPDRKMETEAKQPRVISFTPDEKEKTKQKDAVVVKPASPTSTLLSRSTTATAATDAYTHMM